MSVPVLNATHDPALTSWVESANVADCDFPIQNLPFAVFRATGSARPFRVGVGIGNQVLDIAAAQACAALAADAHNAAALSAARACEAAVLNPLMELGPAAWSALRDVLSRLLRRDEARQSGLHACLLPQAEAEFALPARIGDYTDFYTSIHHATAVGRLFRPDRPLLPNYRWVPIAYHGRASSLGVSGESFVRPAGQILPAGADVPLFAPSARLDFELELGVFIGRGNARGTRIAIESAESHAFGLCLLNDWSARDIQSWEYQPLGPFLAKSFATTISPWVVTLEALAPFRAPLQRPAGDPPPLPYLESAANRATGAFDIELDVWLETEAMRRTGAAPTRLSRSNCRHAWWTPAQMIAHHSANGCNLAAGDLLATGTLSGPDPDQAGSLLELSLGGRQPLQLPDGEVRTFLADGDAVILTAHCERAGHRRIGFGECRGRVLPALDA